MARIATRIGIIGVDDRGGGDATPIVFLHGVGSDKSAWSPQLDRFGQDRRAVAIDYPGYGESESAQPSDLAPHDQFARAILAALDALGIDRAHVCGLSLGGVVAIALAHHAPHRIVSLTIADSFALHPEGPAILARSVQASRDMRALAQARVPVLLAPGATTTLAQRLVEVMAAIEADAFRLGSVAVWPTDQRDRARAVVAPTLLLCGTEDLVTPPALSNQLAALIHGSQLSLIANAGHLPNIEQPELFDAVLAEFLAKTERKQVG